MLQPSGMDAMILPPMVEWSHWIIKRVLQPGDVGFDATVGNGNDLVMMASLVGEQGLVIGCDVQEHAIESAKTRAAKQGLSDRVRLYVESHENIDRICADACITQLRAIMFNLGYLPGGEKSIHTNRETTIAALRKSLELLAPGGVMTIVAYRGHVHGAEETRDVLAWCNDLPLTQFEVVQCSSPLIERAPIGIAIARRIIR